MVYKVFIASSMRNSCRKSVSDIVEDVNKQLAISNILLKKDNYRTRMEIYKEIRKHCCGRKSARWAGADMFWEDLSERISELQDLMSYNNDSL